MLSNILLALPLLSAVSALPARLATREVPQEHAHQNVLDIVDAGIQLNNPDKLGSSVFGLLGAAAAAGGVGNLADADCLQQAIADQAFTNGKAASDVNLMSFALIYRALERNTGSVGKASVPCASVKAVNPEIAALQQHQDPAGTGAQALNKEIATELAKQIASIGGDATLANEASTFAPGDLNDSTAKGFTCDDEKDKAGCINSLKLRVNDLSAAEIQAAISGVGAGAPAAGNGAGAAEACAAPTGTVAAAPAATTAAAASNKAGAGNNKAGAGNNKAGAGNNKAGAGNNNAAAGNNNAAAGNNTAAAGNNNAATGNNNAATGNNNAATGNNNAGAVSSAAFGSCDASIVFSQNPSDGRQEAAFEANDAATFNHGSALNIGVISDFICQQAVSKCNIDAATAATCTAASTAAKKLKGQAAADSFNAAIGF